MRASDFKQNSKLLYPKVGDLCKAQTWKASGQQFGATLSEVCATQGKPSILVYLAVQVPW